MTEAAFQHWATEPASLSPELTIVVPAYNESERIVPTLISIAARMTEMTTDFEIVVSDDGSTDDTPQLVRSLGLRNVIVLDPGVNRGKGAAVRAGVHAAHGDQILFSDADMSTPISELTALRACLADGADVAIGSRAAEGRPSSPSRSAVACSVGGGARSPAPVWASTSPTPSADSNCSPATQPWRCSAQAESTGSASTRNCCSSPLDSASTSPRCPSNGLMRRAPRFGRAVWRSSSSATLAGVRWNALVGRYPASADLVVDRRMRMAVVTAVPPSSSTLTEYGHHLVQQFASKPEIGELIVFADDSAGLPDDTEGITYRAAWTFGSWTTPLRILRQIQRDRPDVVFFNAHFTSFGSGKIAAAAGLLTPALVRLTRARERRAPPQHRRHGRSRPGRVRLQPPGQSGACRHRTNPHPGPAARRHRGDDDAALRRCTPRAIRGGQRLPDPARHLRGTGRTGRGGRERSGPAARVREVRHLQARSTTSSPPTEFSSNEDATSNASSPAPTARTPLGTSLPSRPRTTTFPDFASPATSPRSTSNNSSPTRTSSSSPTRRRRAAVAHSTRPAPTPGQRSYRRVGDFVDLIEQEGFIAAVFEPGDVDSMVRAITELIDDPDRRRQMDARTSPLRARSPWRMSPTGTCHTSSRCSWAPEPHRISRHLIET